ncbi:protein amnionless isoform X2 [Pithys albifrons albifrons]|uniref:protein amnionless isoform X2 n=1 Tax=Pithys albifrons albifrons TaxID=3385563 RepID=UPI003A5CCA60
MAGCGEPNSSFGLSPSRAPGRVQGPAGQGPPGRGMAACCTMKRPFFLLGVLQLLAAAAAVYKQWIPNTNFETASNWDKGRVPCASDVVHFEKDKYLPLNGEFVLAAGAGFTAFDGSWDPGCDSGETVRFADAEQHAWFNPTLWQDVFPNGELKPSGRIFSVDEERVPCRYDDVIFQAETSFRVNTDSSQQVIHLRSISVMGQELSTPASWAGYLQGPSAPLQFHGNGTLQVTGTGCPDKSGCACGNTLDGPRICAALFRALGRRCPAPVCQSPLQPLGHCCGVCGATINLDFTPDFDLQKYQDRLIQELLSQPKYAGVQMAISKVHKAQTFLGIILRSSTPLIQIVLIDDRAGVQAGTTAEQLAADIMEDVAQHGEALGISSGKVEVATGSTSSGQVGSHTLSRITAGTVMGLLFGLLFLGGILFLYRKGKLRLPALRFPQPWDRLEDPVSAAPPSDKGFDNPMFNVEPPSTDPGEETPKDLQVFYLNPLYDASETET